MKRRATPRTASLLSHTRGALGTQILSISPGQVQVGVDTVLSGYPEEVSLQGERGRLRPVYWANLWSPKPTHTLNDAFSTTNDPYLNDPVYFSFTKENE